MTLNQRKCKLSRLGLSLFALLILVATLSMEPATGSNVTSGPGDVKTGYDSKTYETRSISVLKRKGAPADLMRVLQSPPRGLPPVPVPKDNPMTQKKVLLGRKLFFDRRLSLNETMSCAMCHVPEQGFTNNEMATAVGIEGRTVRRNAPTIYNVAYFSHIFHDGRETRLEYQVWQPMLNLNEMANPGFGYVVGKIRSFSDYKGLFESAFEGRGPGIETIGMAIASYERTIVSGNSAFDRWYFDNDESALSASAQRGFGLFTGKAGCMACHVIHKDYALFTDDAFHNTGLGWRFSVGDGQAEVPVQIAPGVKIMVPKKVIDSVGKPPPSDLGRYEVTQDPADRWRYKTPTLRNVALTAPYMHNGVFGTLKDVVSFYNKGGIPNPGLDPSIRPLGLTDDEMADIVAFLQSLTGDNVETLVRDAFAAPIGDRR
ncbi:MAG: c-type cytochrome [Desulfobacterales bacterium]|jgi:cytochrome c peroxidase|nr:c-type cytochrome [Desulfobacterales bacterium]